MSIIPIKVSLFMWGPGQCKTRRESIKNCLQMCGLTLSYKTKAIYSGLISLNLSPPISINYLKHIILKNKLGENCVWLKAAQLLMTQECSDTSNTVDSDMNYLSPKASPHHSACFIFVWRKGLRDELEECISSGSSGVTVCIHGCRMNETTFIIQR